MDLNTRKILSLFASILFTIPVYIILHEGGHALIALSCGARITEFSILGAYMRYGGGTFTALTLSLFYIAGMLLPVLISIAYLLLYRDAAQSVFYRIFSFLFPLILTAPALAWGIVPLLYLSDQAPPGDDVTGFIESSGASPWAVLLGAVLLFAGCLFLACCQARRVMSRSRGAKAVPLVRIGRYPPYTEGIYGAEQKDLRGCNRQLRKFQP